MGQRLILPGRLAVPGGGRLAAPRVGRRRSRQQVDEVLAVVPDVRGGPAQVLACLRHLLGPALVLGRQRLDGLELGGGVCELVRDALNLLQGLAQVLVELAEEGRLLAHTIYEVLDVEDPGRNVAPQLVALRYVVPQGRRVYAAAIARRGGGVHQVLRFVCSLAEAALHRFVGVLCAAVVAWYCVAHRLDDLSLELVQDLSVLFRLKGCLREGRHRSFGLLSLSRRRIRLKEVWFYQLLARRRRWEGEWATFLYLGGRVGDLSLPKSKINSSLPSL